MTLAKTIARAWTDPEFKAKLLSDTHAALADAGIEVPAGTAVNVVEDTADTQHIVLPVAPADSGEVSIDVLEEVAGGLGKNWSVGCPL